MGLARIREEEMEFPTYEVGEGEKNPLFLEKRVYQGSSGKVYPLPVVDRVSDEKAMKRWKVVVMENEWLLVWVMPELGGRIQRAYDKTDGYDFVYYNRVIKPALVGLAGPWISGGIEFNWPQHHRPTTFSPIEHSIEEGEGGVAVVLSEIDKINGTRMLARYRLPSSAARIDIEVRLYNGTDLPQSFMWWANPAVSVNESTQSIFPPDVRAVMDHGKRDVSRFPLAVGTYYKVDYSRGVDISRYANIPVPTSYMAYRSDYDFIGNYDYGRRAGLLHVADHRVSPGKKQWTWGNGDFGRAWDRNLTDEDGPYIELMTGVFTDNQPDFTWIAPHEEKCFVQSFMPYKGIGAVKNATRDVAVALELRGPTAWAGVYASSPRRGARIELSSGTRLLLSERANLGPEEAWTRELPRGGEDLGIEVFDESGRSLVAYRVEAAGGRDESLPAPAAPIPRPEELPDAQSLWLAGRHLEQYRHATFDPRAYYLDGLRRFPRDIRLNAAYGELLLRDGLVAEAEPYLAAAAAELSRHNSNPADAEPLFYLAEAYRRQGRLAEAEDAFGKAAWSGPWQCAAQFELARLCLRRGDVEAAIGHAELSLDRNRRDPRTLHVLGVALRLAGRAEEAEALVRETLARDPLDFLALHESVALGVGATAALEPALGEGRLNLEVLAEAYAELGLYAEAAGVVEANLGVASRAKDPILRYLAGHWLGLAGDDEGRDRLYRAGAELGPDRVFPNRAVEEEALADVVSRRPGDGRARYYLGNLLYDKRRWSEAILQWEKSRDAAPSFPTPRRNLAIAYFNKSGDKGRALAELQAAFDLDQADARVLLELDQLKKKVGFSPADRLSHLDSHIATVEKRDDLCAERIVLLNSVGRFGEALEACLSRRFHPWEGGEGIVTKQFGEAHIGLALEALRKGDAARAASLLSDAANLPENLGEGKLFGARDNDVDYFSGRAAAASGRDEAAEAAFRRATEGPSEPASFMFYNDQPPEKIFYQGLAYRALGSDDLARGRFNRLVDYGERHRDDRVRVDYFAVSLPDFLIFDEDLDKRNRVHCDFLVGLGLYGLGDGTGAAARWESCLAEDPSHQGALLHLRRARSGDLG